MQEIHRDTPGSTSNVEPYQEIIHYALRQHLLDESRENNDPHGEYHTALWTFTRIVRSYFGENADPHAVFWNVVAPEIEHRGGWRMLDTGLDLEEIYFEFVCNWDAVRYAIGETPLGNALAKAEAYPLRPNRASRQPRFFARYSKFVSIAGWLQVAMGNRPILLPVAKLAQLLNVEPMTITRYRQTAVRDGYLEVVAEHVYTKGRATEFIFDVTRFEVLQEMAGKRIREIFAAKARL